MAVDVSHRIVTRELGGARLQIVCDGREEGRLYLRVVRGAGAVDFALSHEMVAVVEGAMDLPVPLVDRHEVIRILGALAARSRLNALPVDQIGLALSDAIDQFVSIAMNRIVELPVVPR